MGERIKHKPHEDVLTVVTEALNGNSFYVNRAAQNGALAKLPQDVQEAIVAVANENHASFIEERIIPKDEMEAQRLKEIVLKKRDLSLKLFFGLESDISEELDKYYNGE